MKNSEELKNHWELDLFTRLPKSLDAGRISGIKLLDENGEYTLSQLLMGDPQKRIILSDQEFAPITVRTGDTLTLTWTFNFGDIDDEEQRNIN